MHLLLSFPDHLAVEAEFVASTPVDEEGTTTETSQPSEDDNDDDVSAAGVILQLGIFILIPVAMYFLLIRPRRRMMRQQQQLQRSVEVGDEVLLTSGMYGFVTGFEEGSDVVWVEVDDDVQVRVTRAGISGKVATPASTESAAPVKTAAEPTATPSGRPTLKGGSKQAAADAADAAEPVDE
jgi:preprotein translocase subunit YajC